MKKHLRYLYIFAILSVLVVGCSNNEDQASNEPEDQTKVEDSSDQQESTKDSESSDQEEGKDSSKDGQASSSEDKDNAEKKDSTSKDSSDQKSADDETSSSSDQSNDSGSKDNSSNDSKASNNQSSGGEEGKMENANVPNYTVNFKEGLVPQQRLVEVDLETDKPQNYYVSVDTKVLEYRKEVDLYVGLVDSTNEDEIKKMIRVQQKS